MIGEKTNRFYFDCDLQVFVSFESFKITDENISAKILNHIFEKMKKIEIRPYLVDNDILMNKAIFNAFEEYCPAKS